eukprot:7746846-Lingulodinium_polyedra.AAC.1
MQRTQATSVEPAWVPWREREPPGAAGPHKRGAGRGVQWLAGPEAATQQGGQHAQRNVRTPS